MCETTRNPACGRYIAMVFVVVAVTVVTVNGPDCSQAADITWTPEELPDPIVRWFRPNPIDRPERIYDGEGFMEVQIDNINAYLAVPETILPQQRVAELYVTATPTNELGEDIGDPFTIIEGRELELDRPITLPDEPNTMRVMWTAKFPPEPQL